MNSSLPLKQPRWLTPIRMSNWPDALATLGTEKYGRFVFAALAGIPWVGSVIAAASALHAEQEQGTSIY
jgi:hypothetical protein